ncbi:MAG: tol-pal system-associated acyl-CoA thioesterase [Gammaproteobacteria bacterium]|jgi:acyl-CoA thioester hydrolase|nr:tol-pal system-associated acyl-CoA thioesterase [Gammaproteobacteria bacterium]
MSGVKLNKLTFSWPIRVYYEDTDAGGIVYYANYLKFLERARTEWLRSLGIEQDTWLAHRLGFVVRQVQMDLLAPARFNDELMVTVVVEKLGRASVVFSQQVLSGKPGNETIFCQAQIKAACVNLGQAGDAVKAVPMPAEIFEVLKRAN